MTAIVGIFDGERCWMAADGRSMAGDVIVSDLATKILRRGRWLLGIAGDRRAHEAIEHLPESLDAEFSEVNQAIRDAMSAIGWRLGEKDEPSFSFSVLIGGAEGLFHHCTVGTAIQVEALRAFAIGSGGCYAEAASWQALRDGRSPEEAVRFGVEAATAYVPTCGGRIMVLCSEDERLPGREYFEHGRFVGELGAA